MGLRFFRFVILLMTALCLASCSWITTFVVANKSENQIIVEYKISTAGSKMPACPDDYLVLKPKKIKLENIENIEKSTDSMEYLCNSELRTVKITVQPGYAASIFRSGTFTGISSIDEDVVTLNIVGSNGTSSYTGRQVTSNFRKLSETLYVLTYN